MLSYFLVMSKCDHAFSFPIPTFIIILFEEIAILLYANK
jgi:hypothetical protein